jgi:hypothetical protein
MAAPRRDGFARAQHILPNIRNGSQTLAAPTTVQPVATNPLNQGSFAEPVTGKFGGDARIERLGRREIGAAAVLVLLRA